MSPGVLTAPTRPALADRRARGVCINSERHGRAFKAGRCRRCYARHRAGVKKWRLAHRGTPRGREVTAANYRRFRAKVVAAGMVSHGHPGEPTSLQHQCYLRAVSEATDQLLAKGGWYVVRRANERPPGWSLELDIAEEMAALSEMVAMRRCA